MLERVMVSRLYNKISPNVGTGTVCALSSFGENLPLAETRWKKQGLGRGGTDLEGEDGGRLGVDAAGDPGLRQRARPAREVVVGGRPHPPRRARQRRRLPPGQPGATGRRDRLHVRILIPPTAGA